MSLRLVYGAKRRVYQFKMGSCKKAVLVYSRLILYMSLNIIFVCMLLVKLIQSSVWSWGIVFSPLFLFDLILIVYVILYVYGLIKDRLIQSTGGYMVCFPHQRANPVPPILYATGTLSKILAEILLVLYLDRGTPPFYVSSIFIMGTLISAIVGLLIYSIKPIVKQIHD